MKKSVPIDSKAPEVKKPNYLNHLLYKVGQCIDYQSLYTLEEEFNKCGLTIQTTPNNRMILCKLRNGRPIAESIIDDYTFIGSLDKATDELTDRTVVKLTDFIRTHAGAEDKVGEERVWRNGLRMYESTVTIMHEDVNKVADVINE